MTAVPHRHDGERAMCGVDHGTETLAQIEGAVNRHQWEWVIERYGEDVANKANFGWFVDELDIGVLVSSKVYGHGVLTTRSEKVGEFADTWEERS